MNSIRYTIGALALLVLFSGTLVMAQEDQDVPGDRDSVRAEREERRANFEATQAERAEAQENRRAEFEASQEERTAVQEERRAEMETKREERRQEFSERAKERIGGYLERVVARMSAMTDRLDDIADRLESRLETIAESGEDTEAANALLSDARDAIASARDAIASLEVAGAELIESIETPEEANASVQGGLNPRDSLLEVKELAAAARESLKEAHAALISAVEGIKSLNLSASVLNSVE